MDEVINKDDFQLFNNQLSKKIMELKENIENIYLNRSSSDDRQQRIEDIQTILQNGSLLLKAEFKVMFDEIDKILIYPDRYMEIVLKKETVTQSDIENTENIEDDDFFFRIKVPYEYKNKYKIEQEKLDKKVLELIKQNPAIMLKDMTSILDESYYKISQAAKRLRENGMIKMQRHGNGKTSWYLKTSPNLIEK